MKKDSLQPSLTERLAVICKSSHAKGLEAHLADQLASEIPLIATEPTFTYDREVMGSGDTMFSFVLSAKAGSSYSHEKVRLGRIRQAIQGAADKYEAAVISRPDRFTTSIAEFVRHRDNMRTEFPTR